MKARGRFRGGGPYRAPTPPLVVGFPGASRSVSAWRGRSLWRTGNGTANNGGGASPSRACRNRGGAPCVWRRPRKRPRRIAQLSGWGDGIHGKGPIPRGSTRKGSSGTGGTVLAAGSPVRISGKISWSGAIDARSTEDPGRGGAACRPGLFDRLDGTMTVEARITGTGIPSIVGTGQLEAAPSRSSGTNRFSKGTGDAVLSREKIVFDHFEARSGGATSTVGEVPLKMDAGQRLYFSADFLDMRYPYPRNSSPSSRGISNSSGPSTTSWSPATWRFNRRAT